MYLTNTIPDIWFAVNTLSQYLVKPRRVHLVAAKHVYEVPKRYDSLWFILCWRSWLQIVWLYRCTLGWKCLKHERAPQVDVIVWDPPWSHGLVRNNPVLLSVQLKHSTLQLAPLVGKRYGFEKLMSGLFDMELDTTVILCDNRSCIKMTKNLVFHDK